LHALLDSARFFVDDDVVVVVDIDVDVDMGVDDDLYVVVMRRPTSLKIDHRQRKSPSVPSPR
jgi:hypothetical protein